MDEEYFIEKLFPSDKSGILIFFVTTSKVLLYVLLT